MSNLKYDIGFDYITGEREIEWSHYLVYKKISDLNKGWEIRLDFNIKNGKPCLHFRFRGIKLRTKDKLYIGSCLQYVELTVLKTPHRFGDKLKEVDFILLDEDLLNLRNNGFNSLHIRFNNGDAPFDADFIFFSSVPYKHSLNEILSGKTHYEERCDFTNYFELYRKALKEARWCCDISDAIGVKKTKPLKLPHNNIASEHEKKYDYCYVYLMHDTRNGYHKIGMSNKPEVREKTLQSEVPAIEMVCSKRYPTRKIAKAIEAALHNAYAEQRVRGEWFNLSPLEIEMLKETLS